MESTIITVFGSVIIACLTYYFTKKQSTATHWREQKLNHYKVLLSSMSGIADGTEQEIARENFALAVNTIALVAPQYVIDALMDLCDEIKVVNSNISSLEHQKLLVKLLLLAIRKDIGLAKSDDAETFKFELVAAGSKGRKK